MPAILCVCTANQFRSPFAAACLQAEIQAARPAGVWQVESAGTWAEVGRPAALPALQIARRLGVEGLAGHRTRPVAADLLAAFDLILVMEAGHKEALAIEFPASKPRLRLLTEAAGGLPGDLPDPALPGVDGEQVAAEILRLIRQGGPAILRLAETLAAARQ